MVTFIVALVITVVVDMALVAIAIIVDNPTSKMFGNHEFNVVATASAVLVVAATASGPTALR